MRIKILTFMICVLFSSISWADEYVLVMSKEDNVCQHMLKLYNDDLKKYGGIKYVKHKESNAIKWEDKKYYTMQEGKKIYPVLPYDLSTTVKISTFDINNDGKDETVIKTINSFRGIESDDLFYFKNEDASLFNNDEFDIKILGTKSVGRIFSGAGSNYQLKELPQFLYVGIGDKEAKAYYSLGVYLYIHPFFFDGTYYLEINDEVPHDSKGIYSSKFLVILKYIKDNQLKDVCYCIKTTDCRKENK